MKAADLYKTLSERTGGKIKPADVERIVHALREESINAVKNGDEINLPGFMVIYGKTSSAKTGRNPATGESIEIPERLRMRVRVSKNATGKL